MELTSIKLVVSDLDGTLVKYGSNQISETTKNSVVSFTKQGGFFTVSTGRSWNQARELIKELPITIPVIVQSGAIIIDPVRDRVLRTRPLRRKIEAKLGEMTRFINREKIAIDQFCLSETGVYYTTRINTDGGNWLFNNAEKCLVSKKRRLHPHPSIKYFYIGARPEMELISQKIIREIKPTPNIVLWPPRSGKRRLVSGSFRPAGLKGKRSSMAGGLPKNRP